MSLGSSKTMYVKQFQDLNSPSFQFFTIIMLMSIYFLLIIPHASSLNFSYSEFLPNERNLEYDRDANPPTQSFRVIQLTNNREGDSKNGSCGQVKYSQKMQLWEKTSGNLTDFTTHFSFIINSKNESNYADGLAFFLAANDSLPNNIGAGGAMCLPQGLNSTVYPFVAVEFDIFYNSDWDTITREHVGVDINSMKSVAVEPWEGANDIIMAGERNEAQISYNSSSLNLSVVFTGYRNATKILQEFHTKVDLKDYLPERVTFGFTASTGDLFALFEIRSWNFSSTLEIPENRHDPVVEEPVAGHPIPGSRSNANAGLAVGLGIGGIVLILTMGLIYCLCKKWNKNIEEEDQRDDGYTMEDFATMTGPKKYSYAELASATNNFEDENKLGQGGFGGVYKGFLKDLNSYVAIKRISENSGQGIKEFTSEVTIISQLRHRNLVQLIGWCHERKQLLLVYEYMPNRSLNFHLFNNQIILTWKVRYRISQGLASALLYLHEECEQCVLHRDIKSSNIMLDSNFNAKLGDFGLARLVDHAKGVQTTNLAGTLGYIAPECAITGKASKESDIYSFGVVILEIICGRTSINFETPENDMNNKMVKWVWELYGNGRILEAADPRLGGDFEQHEMKHLMIVGLWCAHPDLYSRPSIRQAIQVLNFEAPLPHLSSSFPVLTFMEHPAAIPDQNTSTSNTSNTNSSSITRSF